MTATYIFIAYIPLSEIYAQYWLGVTTTIQRKSTILYIILLVYTVLKNLLYRIITYSLLIVSALYVADFIESYDLTGLCYVQFILKT
jgi:hypothetical protein